MQNKRKVASIKAKTNYPLIIGGFLAITLLAFYLGNAIFRDNVVALFTEVALYIGILVIYFLSLRNPQQELLALLSRVISYAGIITVILIAFFIAYFVATFRW